MNSEYYFVIAGSGRSIPAGCRVVKVYPEAHRMIVARPVHLSPPTTTYPDKEPDND